MQDTNLNACYQAALDQAAQIGAECNTLSDEFPNGSDLYKKASFGGVCKDILRLLFGLVLMAVGVMSFVPNKPFMIFEYGFPGRFMGILIFGFGASFLFTSIFSLYKMIQLSRAKHKAKTIRTLGVAVTGEAAKLETFAQQVEKAIAAGEDMTIVPSGFWQTQFTEFRTAVAEKSRNDDRKNRWIHTIAAVGIFAFAAIALYPFVIGGYGLKYGNVSGALVATAYILLAVILSESLARLDRWYHKKAKLIAGLVFGLYQVAVVLGLLLGGAFDGISAAIAGGDVWPIVQSIVFSYPILSMILITVITVLIITRSHYDLIAIRMEEPSYQRDMSDGTTQTVILKRQKTKIRAKCVFKLPFIFAMGIWMGGIVNEGLSFGNVLLFLLIAVFYFGITFTMDMDESFNYVYGKLSGYLRLLLFAGYVTIALSLIPNFGVGTVILLAIHSLASLGGPAVTFNESSTPT